MMSLTYICWCPESHRCPHLRRVPHHAGYAQPEIARFRSRTALARTGMPVPWQLHLGLLWVCWVVYAGGQHLEPFAHAQGSRPPARTEFPIGINFFAFARSLGS